MNLSTFGCSCGCGRCSSMCLSVHLCLGARKVQSVVCWARCPVWCSVVGFNLLWASGRGDFSPGFTWFLTPFPQQHRLVGLVVKASASRAEDPGFESRLRWDFYGVKSYQWLKHWHSSGYPARRLALQGQHWDWSARCQYTVTGWGRTFDLQLLSQCGST